MRSAVFLDRDGVINVDRHYVCRREDFEFAEGIFGGLRRLVAHGHQIVIATNQSAIGRGYCSAAAFEQLSQWMLAQLAAHGVSVTALYHCPHLPDAGCQCRKPAPGMLLQAAAEHDLDLTQSWMIGDKETDIEAALDAGLRQTILIRAGHDRQPRVATRASLVCESLRDAARRIIAPVGRPSRSDQGTRSPAPAAAWPARLAECNPATAESGPRSAGR
jgi:D-glycero-D-manno-heptose 1,7-bisphosphate phosphatase